MTTQVAVNVVTTKSRSMCDDCNDVFYFPCHTFRSELDSKKGIYSSIRNSCIREEFINYTFICTPMKCDCCCCEARPGSCLNWEDCMDCFCNTRCHIDCSFCACCLCNCTPRCISCIAKNFQQTSDPNNSEYRSCVHYIPPLCSASCATCICFPLLFTIPFCGSNCICPCIYEYKIVPSCPPLAEIIPSCPPLAEIIPSCPLPAIEVKT
jgi:hypothetical protein